MSITEESPEILNPASTPILPQATLNPHIGRGTDMVVPLRHRDDDRNEGRERRAIRKIKSQSNVESSI